MFLALFNYAVLWDNLIVKDWFIVITLNDVIIELDTFYKAKIFYNNDRFVQSHMSVTGSSLLKL